MSSMAVSGKLEEFLIEDVISLVGNKVGRLVITGVPGFQSLFIDMLEGKVVDFQINEIEGLDEAYLRSSLKHIVSAREGAFKFEAKELEALNQRLNISVNLMIFEVVRTVEELRHHFTSLPQPWQKFVLTDNYNHHEHEPSAEDACYLALTSEQLKVGATAFSMNQEFGIPEIYLQSFLYRWDKMGIVMLLESDPLPPFEQQTDPIEIPLEQLCSRTTIIIPRKKAMRTFNLRN
jgi:hypothetical protein